MKTNCVVITAAAAAPRHAVWGATCVASSFCE
jgi:hypothetical protein